MALTPEQGRFALQKLQSGRALTDEEKVYLGLLPAPTPVPTPAATKSVGPANPIEQNPTPQEPILTPAQMRALELQAKTAAAKAKTAAAKAKLADAANAANAAAAAAAAEAAKAKADEAAKAAAEAKAKVDAEAAAKAAIEAKAAQDIADAKKAADAAAAEAEAKTAAEKAAAEAEAKRLAELEKTRPGAAWILNQDKTGWIKPAAPLSTQGESYTWDDNKGYVKTGTSSTSVDNSADDGSTGTDTGTGTGTVGLDQTTQDLIKSLQDQIAELNKQSVATALETQTQREAIGKVLQDRFSKYGLGTLSNKIMELARGGATEATITLALQDTEEYQMRFAANADRIKKGLTVLTPAEYLSAEDAYRQTLRAYGLNQFDNDQYVKQFIANDVSAAELSNRVSIAVQRIQNADPNVTKTLRDFYGIGTTDMLGYILDPAQALPKIQEQVAAAEIGAAARTQGLEAGVSVSEQLARQGISQAEAQKGYATIADILPTAEKLSQIYGASLSGYDQAQAEQEVFNSLASAQRKRRALTARETASFSGAAGTTRTSLTSSQQGSF